MRIKKVIPLTAAGILLAAIVIIIATASFFTHRKISYNEHFFTGVVKSVTIERDITGIPLIHASNPSDAWYALGYTHAFDRLPVMEYDRLVAAGGAESVFADDDASILSRLVVVLEIKEQAAALYAKLDEKHRRMLDFYTAGVNDSKKKHSLAFYADSGFNASPWKSEDLLSIAIFRDWAHSFLSASELQFALPEKKYFPALEDFFQPGVICRYKDRNAPSAQCVLNIKKAVERYAGTNQSSIAFYFPKKDTEDECFSFFIRKPTGIYPELETVLFDIDGRMMTCVTRAGSPFPDAVISGKIRYSVLPAGIDAMDFYLLPVENREGKDGYYSDLSWKNFSNSTQRMKGGEFTFRKTDFGPVLSDVISGADSSSCVAIRYAEFGIHTVEALLDLPFSTALEDSVRTASLHDGFPKIFLINESDRSVILPAGHLPMRPGRGFFFKEYNFTPQNFDLSSLKKYFNGQKVFVGSKLRADMFPQIAEYIPYSFDPFMDEIRTAVLGDASRSSIIALLRRSDSPVDYSISRSFIKMLDSIPVTSSKLSKVYLGDWNSSLSSASRAPVIYYQLYNQLIEETFEDELGSDLRQIQEKPWLINSKLSLMIGKTQSKAFDNITTPDDFETFDKVFGNAFIKSMRILHRVYGPEMDAWQWSRVHFAAFRIPFMHNDMITRMFMDNSENTVHSSAEVIPAVNAPGRYEVKDYAALALVSGAEIVEIRNFGISIHPRSEFIRSSPSEFSDFNTRVFSKKYSALIEPRQPSAVISQ